MALAPARAWAATCRAACASVAAARQLYGAGSDEVNAVTAAWDGVGVSAL